MPRAEFGSTKHLSNQLKSKGLQRLRWYCQVCERQMRDENGFKMHVQSESHVRQMMVVGDNAGKFISDYTKQFQRDFLQLLRTSHGEKRVNINHFYQEYIANKTHVHMNATRFTSLTEFAKYLGREGICRVEEGERGFEIAWIDNSPEALRRQDAIRKKERQDRGDEEREQRLIQQQVDRARRAAESRDDTTAVEDEDQARTLQRDPETKITLNFGMKPAKPPADATPQDSGKLVQSGDHSLDQAANGTNAPSSASAVDKATDTPQLSSTGASTSEKRKPKNVFAAAAKKKSTPASTSTSDTASASKTGSTRPMSEAERIMREELDRKRRRESYRGSNGGDKRQRI